MQYPITQLFRVDAALVLEKMKHHQTYRFHPRPDASEGGPALMSGNGRLQITEHYCLLGKKNGALASDAMASWQYLMPLAILLWSIAECSLHLKW